MMPHGRSQNLGFASCHTMLFILIHQLYDDENFLQNFILLPSSRKIGYTLYNHKRNADIRTELNITAITDTIESYRNNCFRKLFSESNVTFLGSSPKRSLSSLSKMALSSSTNPDTPV
ncbi:hypothetical protein ANN_19393 [Periplaneta americana]|uniref:Uncharacterized protein n=1 Tax=Periplaneta americana TaxID=6978 RepID=A0ABQ8SA31_PERAM|nr:hypothetical protein ANN_19393 [Periplaneta americana]